MSNNAPGAFALAQEIIKRWMAMTPHERYKFPIAAVWLAREIVKDDELPVPDSSSGRDWELFRLPAKYPPPGVPPAVCELVNGDDGISVLTADSARRLARLLFAYSEGLP